jgi:outer membrane receptor protein involved in Fe transport
VDVAVNARPSAGILMSGGVSTGRQTSDNCDVVTKVDNPSPLYCHAQEAFQTQVKFSGSYTVPRVDLRLSGSLLNGPGPAITASYVAPLAEIQPSLGRPLAGAARNATVNIVEPGTMYGDRYTQVDVRIAKIFAVGTSRLTPQLDIYNLLNSNVVTALSNAYATWLRPQGIMPPRFVKVGLQVNF